MVAEHIGKWVSGAIGRRDGPQNLHRIPASFSHSAQSSSEMSADHLLLHLGSREAMCLKTHSILEDTLGILVKKVSKTACSKDANMQGNMVYWDLCLGLFNIIGNSIYSTSLAHGGYGILYPRSGKYGYQIWHFKITNHTPIQEIGVFVKWVSHTLPRMFFIIVANNDHWHMPAFNQLSPRRTFSRLVLRYFLKLKSQDNWQVTCLKPYIKLHFNTNLNSSWREVGFADSSCFSFYFFSALCSSFLSLYCHDIFSLSLPEDEEPWRLVCWSICPMLGGCWVNEWMQFVLKSGSSVH